MNWISRLLDRGDNLALFMVNEELVGVNQSTVSCTLARAKRNVRRETERACAAVRPRAGAVNVDVTNPFAAKTVLFARTPKQGD